MDQLFEGQVCQQRDLVSGVVIGITEEGKVVAIGFGDIKVEEVAPITCKCVLVVSKLRNAARTALRNAMLSVRPKKALQ